MKKQNTNPAKPAGLRALGNKVTKFTGIETFPKPPRVSLVVCKSDEVTALCPVTDQPDWYQVEVIYEPDKRCVESKSLKLYYHSLRNTGAFGETLASSILKTLASAIRPFSMVVKVTQKARGGISIESTATL